MFRGAFINPIDEFSDNIYFFFLFFIDFFLFIFLCFPIDEFSDNIYIFLCVFHSYTLGDTDISILKDVGTEEMKDVDSLPAPSEIKDASRFKGDVSYFTCTRPGRGPVLLSDESQALLKPGTGMPK